ncbi:MAG TPA: DUF1295 domain-containing protein [Bryobacterales bacterium]|nr:DUF1295 domain-containing protein [Bryobacterales bacterium]
MERPLPLFLKIVFALLHLLADFLVYWLLFGGGLRAAQRFGLRWEPGDFPRRVLLMGCSAVYFLRTLVTAFVFLKRRMTWSEAATTAVWRLLVHAAFAVSGGTNRRPVGLLAVIGAILYWAGSCLNTGSEFQRHVWKQKPENQGKLYTQGLFRLAIHINYVGDLVLFAGFAMIAGSPYTALIPPLTLAGFVIFNIPGLDRHLCEKYGAAFEEYACRTKKLTPFVY